MGIFILNNWYELMEFWDGDTQYKLTEIEFSCSRTPYSTINHEQESGGILLNFQELHNNFKYGFRNK